MLLIEKVVEGVISFLIPRILNVWHRYLWVRGAFFIALLIPILVTLPQKHVLNDQLHVLYLCIFFAILLLSFFFPVLNNAQKPLPKEDTPIEDRKTENKTEEHFDLQTETRIVTHEVQYICNYNSHQLIKTNCLPIERGLDYILDRMVSVALVSHTQEFCRIAVVQPKEDGKFKVLASRSIMFERIMDIVKCSDWKSGETNFGGIVFSNIFEPKAKLSSTIVKEPFEGYEPSKAHLLIPIIEYDAAITKEFEHYLAIVSIGLSTQIIVQDDCEKDRIVAILDPYINGIKQILQNFRRNPC